MSFKLNAPYSPAGDQPDAIRQLTEGVLNGDRYQTLLGVTGMQYYFIRQSFSLKSQLFDQSVNEALNAAKNTAEKNDFIIVCGSVFLVAEVNELKTILST